MPKRSYYGYVKHASAATKQAMQEVADSYTEVEQVEGEGRRFSVAFISECGYYLKREDCAEMDAPMVRCSACGAVRELYEGQIEFCTECGADWE